MHDLIGRHQPPVHIRQQPLGHHRAQHHAQLYPDLGLLGAGKRVDDAVNGIHRAVGVEGGNEQMPRLRRRHGGADGLVVPHFPPQDHLRCLPQASPQGGKVIRGVNGDLPLADDAPPVPVQVLDGVLQRDDVGLPGAVDAVDDTGLGGGLAAAGSAGDQHHAMGQVRQVHDLFRDAQGPVIRDVKGHQPHHRRKRPPLAVGIHPEPGQARDRKGKVIVSGGPVGVHGAVRHIIQPHDEALRFRREHLFPADGPQVPLHFFADRPAGHDKQVGGLLRHRLLQIVQ